MESRQKRIMEIVLEVSRLMDSMESVPRELVEEYDKLVAESKINVVD